MASGVLGLVLLAGCANEGMWPKEPLPPASAVQPPFRGFQPPQTGSDDERGVLTESEREELEERLSRLPGEREQGVARRLRQGR